MNGKCIMEKGGGVLYWLDETDNFFDSYVVNVGVAWFGIEVDGWG